MLKYFKKNQVGSVLILFMLLSGLVFGFIGLGVDIALVVYQKQAMQDAVDLTALAAAHEVANPYGQVVSTAKQFANNNGLTPGEIKITYPYNCDVNKVEITAKRRIFFSFLRIVGIHSTDVQVRAVAEATVKSTTNVHYVSLDYAVFSAATTADLIIKGNGSVINGNVHGNKKIDFTGTSHTVNGNVEGVAGVTLHSTQVTGTVNTKASILPIPSLSFEGLAAKADRVIEGDIILNDVDINGIWLVNGNLKLNGGRITGKGILLATGAIDLPTNNLQYSTSNDLLALYSQGDITISSTRCNIQGILYAPNGVIRINGSYNTFYGALIAQQIVWATKDIIINGDYDLRAPDAFSEAQAVSFKLVE